MAIRQVGGSPVYTIEVDVPKVTDARGRSYGNLVSDLRWKLWEEVQNSQLQQMKYEQMSKQAQLDVLEQRQRDVSRSIRDANEMKAKIKAGESGGSASSQWLQRAKANQVTYSERTVPIDDPYGIRAMRGLPSTATVTSKTYKSPIGEPPMGYDSGEGDSATAQKNFEQQQAELDKYIQDLQAEQTALGQKFESFTSGLTQGPDILSRTRGAFQSQIGEGGFGISRRPLRQLPRFDELQAVGLLDDTIKREEDALFAEAQKRGLDFSEQEIRQRAREAVAKQLGDAGAREVSRAGFLMNEPPTPSALLPREETLTPTGRMRDDFAVAGMGEPLDRETIVKGELDRVGLGSPEAEGLLMELEDIRRTKRAPVNAPSSIPEAQRRAIDLGFLGVPAEEAQTRGAVPSERGFNYPVERMGEGFGPTTTFGAPSGVLDRTNVATRRLPDVTSPSDGNFPIEPMTFGGGPLPATPEEPQGPEIAPEFGPETEMPEDKVKVPGRAPLPDGTPIEEARAKRTTQSRRDLYSMKTIKKGLELADKPKQFARVAKTENPSAAPEYVKIVNGVYELNASRPDRFKASYDEVARVFKDNPKDRERALSYLIAKDAIESNVTSPLA